MQMFDPSSVRGQFPALNQNVNGSMPVFLDGPGGTQVPKRVMEAFAQYLSVGNSNLLNSPFFAVQNTHKVLAEARQKAAIFVNGQPENMIFGPSMTSLTAHISRAIALEWQAGDEIIVSALDHYSNVSFWRRAAQDRGVKCHSVRVDTVDCSFDYDHYETLLSSKTKLVAFTLASNLSGSRTDAKRIVAATKNVGAMTYADSVHAAPHFLPDVQALDCDFLACSAYKFFGPHLAFVHGKTEHLERLNAYKVEPASNVPPEKWETGTKSFEALAGFNACIDYMSGDAATADLRAALSGVYERVFAYEQHWAKVFLERAKTIPGMRIYGRVDPAQLTQRTPTFAFTIEGHSPQAVSDHLAHANIATGAGNFYAKGIVEALGCVETGLVRAGCVHYNTLEELERLFEALEKL